MKFGEKLKFARKSKKISQKDFAIMVGLSRVSIVNIENGRQQINQDRIYEFCVILNVTPNFLFDIGESIEKYKIIQEECIEMKNRLEKIRNLASK